MINKKLKQIYTKEEIISDNHHEYMKHSQHPRQPKHHQEPNSDQYRVNLHFDPIAPEARRKTMLTISVKEKSGNHISEFEPVHDKLMHLIIVGEDLSYFAHVHPGLRGTNENFFIYHIFPESGKYKLWIDFKPKGGNQTLATFIADVRGFPTHRPIMLAYDGAYIKQASDKAYQISLQLPQKIVAKTDTDIVFSISDALGNPITDLEPLMGAGGHSVIISNIRMT